MASPTRRPPCSSSSCGRHALSTRGRVIPPTRTRRGAGPKDADTRYVSFRQEDFLAATRALDPAGWDGPRRLHVIPGARQADFEAAVDRMLLVGLRIESFPDAERVRWAWMQELAVIVTANSGAEPSYRERSRGYRICRQARAIMEEEFAVGALPSIVDLCRQVRVSRRALEYAFQDYVGASPLEYMRRCRLGRARAVLRTSDPGATTVTAVAMRWGFFHLGRFARDYARLFGELPSTTLGRVA